MPTLKANGKRLNGKGSKWITKQRRLAIYLRDGFHCAYCGRDLSRAHPRQVTLDHLRPVCKGGSHASTNLVTACAACNSRRQHMGWTAFLYLVVWAHVPNAAGAFADRIRIIRRRVPNTKLAKAVLAGTIHPTEALRA